MKYNFQFLQTGGVPLTNDLMQLIEDAYSIFEVLGDIAGNLTILKGCETVGSNVEPGIVAIDGKLYYFEGGLLSDTVFINTEEIEKVFQDQSEKVLILKKTVKFGNSVETYNWVDFVRLETLKEIQIKVNNGVTIQMFNAILAEIELLKLKTAPIINGGIVFPFRKPANEIPVGWKECIDLRGKTVVGRDPNDNDFANLGNTIGTKTHSLTSDQNGQHTHINDYGSEKIGRGNGWWGFFKKGQGNQYTETSRPSGLGAPHNNVQPSRIVNFIEPNFQ